MAYPEHAIDDFWACFRTREPEIAPIESADTPAYEDLLACLQKIDPGLFIEVSAREQSRELIITAEGDPVLFDLVEAIVARAPGLRGWQFHALKPKLGFPKMTSWEGFVVHIADVVFEPLVAAETGCLGIRMFIPGLDPARVSDAHNALLRAIDHGLGERRFAQSIARTELHPLPAGDSKDKYIPLVDLERFLDSRGNRCGSASVEGTVKSADVVPDRRLGDTRDTPGGCELRLMDGTKIRIDVQFAVLNRAVTRLGHESLSESYRTGGPEVCFHPVRMRREEWELIRGIVRDSEAARCLLRSSAHLRGLFGLDYEEVTALPYRVYGGLAPKDCDFYFSLSHPLDFYRRGDQGEEERYCLLSAPGGFLAKTWVNLKTREIRIETGEVSGHFLVR